MFCTGGNVRTPVETVEPPDVTVLLFQGREKRRFVLAGTCEPLLRQ